MVKRRIREWRNDLRMVREQGTFARNAAYAFGGSAVITISQVVLTPIVARIYGPEAYGIYGIFITICLNLAAIAEMGISSAFVLPEEEEKARDLLRANILTLTLILLLMVPFLVFREQVYQLAPSWRNMGAWYYAIPLGTAVQMVPTMLTKWLTRYKEFGRGAAINGGTNLVLRVFNVVYGLLSKGALHGLIIGELVVRSASVPFLIRTMAPHGADRLVAERSLSRIWSTVKEYKRYPLYIFP
ncbi:MAG: oligosaccharide flippase family protein, partial [Flavobacteriales bacterium]|nr:oligosaccharide flippase family protein [Flavobacteriales bacterium]